MAAWMWRRCGLKICRRSMDSCPRAAVSSWHARRTLSSSRTTMAMAGLRCAINCSAATGWNSLRESRPGATCGSAVARDCRPLALCPARTPRVATSRSRSSGVAREHRGRLGGQSCIVQQQRFVGPQARKAKADAGAFRCRSVRPSHHPAAACRLSDAFVKISTVKKVQRQVVLWAETKRHDRRQSEVCWHCA